ncbi:MAG: 16S rRNA (adenine(1518)-N(6)/adenine(1519)-N(6))-dimethyltransferase RsmA [Acidobacteria bacterium]|jgi:16S rRNA (adenine1518-N6/adenine1519-N6)-dimethyltransferase|nr:16S rRNA (adenine(1518)-N(6)/adenine(1519)-N(6))-dimethyltransferase RsmA [Acidobacteriota bacterium]
MPRRLGQHFLADRRVLARIADSVALDTECLVIEIGAGRGALTELMAARAGLVIAVEVDPPLAALLRQKFGGSSRVRVVEADILQLDLRRLAAETGFRRAKAAGNLPYYITSPILLRLFEFSGLFEDLTVMVQREVAERLAAAPQSRDYGLLSVTAQYYTCPELLFCIPPGAFRPPPRVDSALVRMAVAPRGGELGIRDEAAFFRFLRACFQQKRKTLVNNLKRLPAIRQVTAALESLGLSGFARAEELSLEQLASLFSVLQPQRHKELKGSPSRSTL